METNGMLAFSICGRIEFPLTSAKMISESVQLFKAAVKLKISYIFNPN